ELGLSNKDIGSPNSGTNDAARIVLDAVVKWNFAQNFWLWVGQTKLPGNRERVISSQKLQFVDRSLANSKYNIDRDQGLQLRHSFKVGEMVFREIASWSIGEGRNYVKSNRGGFDYTGRIEFLPMGEFTKKGDYFSSDLKREEKPKLAIGVTYDYHDNAVRERGQQGDYMIGERDLQSIMADLMFKFKGISVMSEYISKTTDFPMLYDSSGIASGTFYVGSGMNFQAGYLLKNNWEVAGRYTVITPDSETGNSNITMYTLGISKYVVGHNLKFQTDISYTQEDSKDDKLMWRMQVEVSF
ncbi:hypothetical protein JYU20_02885, partial [Bacteroidales bacterium AH-315-I05]|nr:hypothetical protein [Bacteroidales bacterium AH-315-I05]